MPKRLPTTPKSRVRQALRQLSLRSRERAQALKDANYTCEHCGKKRSVAKGKEVKVEAHHRDGIAVWEEIISMIFRYILVPSEKWQVLCEDCHAKEHACKPQSK